MNETDIVEYDYSQIDKKVRKIIQNTSKYYNWDMDIESQIIKAYEFARDAHHGQFRLSWEPYIDHPVEATLILLDLEPDIYTIQACLLHDVIEDTDKTYDDILNTFWDVVAFLCWWMEKLSKVRYKWEERSIWSLRKMFVAMSDDIRVIFIKLSDRLHNMKTLKFHPKKDKRARIAEETLNIYAPIADRLGLHKIKNSLDEECFKILYPADYKKINKELKNLGRTKKAFISNAKTQIQDLFEWKNIDYKVEFRVKSTFSIYKKIKKKWYESINDLYDIYWIKILVNDVPDCYRILWLIHNKWTPLPKRFKDYIALPKPNWYKSLHTTIIWLLKNHSSQPTEIQIKTFDMNLKSEIWVAAHFDYKENGSKESRDVNWVKQLKELTESLWNNDFMDSLKIDLFKDRIFVLTPTWDTINLPAWSTPIDFAYEIHTDLWNHITLSKVNWQVSQLDRELSNWDVVEVITDKNKKPNPFYISFVKTTKAKNSIRSFLRNEDKDLHRDRWKEILNKLLEKVWLDKLDKDLSILKSFDSRTYSLEERNDLLEQIWNFSTNPTSIIRKILKAKKLYVKKETSKKEDIESKNISWVNRDIIIWDENNIPYKIWSCCQDRLWTKIVAYINSKWVITIHNRDCITLKRLNTDRFLSAYFEWDENNNIIFNIDLVFRNKIWVLKDLSEVLFFMNINTLEINTKKTWLDKMILNLKLEILDHDYLIIDRFLDKIKFKLWDKLVDFKVNKIES